MDTKGGTYQVGTNGVSYHALGDIVPPKQDALNKLLQTTVLAAQSVNTGSGAPLNPWPLDSLNSVLPVACHSHNDYDHTVPVFQALSAGCISMEADVWLFAGDLLIGHILPTPGRTLVAQYVNPLKTIIDHNGGSVYRSRPGQSLVLLVDFKTSDTGTLDAVVKALEPLRQAGYLSRLEGGVLVKKAITVVASGSAPFDRIGKQFSIFREFLSLFLFSFGNLSHYLGYPFRAKNQMAYVSYRSITALHYTQNGNH